ncbi:MAG: tRNA 2-thiouridine(34) synthase MnmA [Spirochaetota bacterium]|nr:tRNA 2-thiouridine(34) synthase MnmA [Spirochaetota bacterium]
MKVAVGISGGVDSSVAAWLLKKEGHDVIGIWMNLFGNDSSSKDAEVVATYLDIPFFKIDLQSEYSDIVISYIKEEYSLGKTPNPCVICNRSVKFGLLIEKALSVGIEFDYFATGHYSIIEYNIETSRFLLKKGIHEGKDQAYFLSMLSQKQLGKIVFPLGGKTKPEVRKMAEEAGLFTTNKKESQDLCSGDYREFIDKSRGPGNFIDENRLILGKHKGIENYTIGQRRGLGISSSTEPYYVIGINPESNEIILGFDNDLLNKGMVVSRCNWISCIKPDFPITVNAKIRYRDNGAPAILKDIKEDIIEVNFFTERRAVTPGQIAVFYDKDIVVGAGIIEKGF